MVVTDTFCALPFAHSCTKVNGENTPCCRFADNKYFDKISPKVYFNGEKLAEVRQLMLDGKQLAGCYKCYQEEELGKKSMRQWANEDFLDPNTQADTPIKFIEISFDNLCNMACVMCHPRDSSKWNDYLDLLDYDKIFGYKSMALDNTDNIIDFTPADYESATYIKLLGGEPFLNVKNIDFLEKFNLENINFETHTNCSLIPNKRWRRILEKIKFANIHLSIDAIGDVASFSRYGVVWEQVQKTMEWFIEFKKLKNIRVSAHGMCHIFNVFDMHNCIQYLESKDLPYRIDCVHDPSHLDIKILPKRIKEKLIDIIKDDYVKNYLIKNIDYIDDDNLNKFLIFAERLQKRQHFSFVDDIVENINSHNCF